MTYRVACLGAGYFSRFHIDGWQRLPDAELVGICDRDHQRAMATGLPAFSELSDMLAQVKPDILDIILPPTGHAQAIETALAAEVPTIICQKPFCRDLAEAAEITARADAVGARLIVHENFRFQPWYRLISDELRAGRIGQVMQATFRLRPGDGQGPDAYLDRQPYFREMPQLLVHETAVHFIDVFRFLFGPASAVYADLRRINPVIKGEDAGLVISEHTGGIRAIFDGNRCLDHAADNTRRTMGEALIEGTDGTLTLTGDGAVHFRAFGNTKAECILPPDTFDGFGGDCTHALQAHVLRALDGGVAFENLASDYLAVIATEQAIYRSAATGCKVAL